MRSATSSHAQDVLGFLFHPLVAADGGDAEHVELLRLQEDEYRLLVAGSRAASILVDDHFDAFLRRCGEPSENAKEYQREPKKRPTHRDCDGPVFSDP